MLSLRVCNMPTVSTISRPRLLVVHSVYKLQTIGPLCTGKRCCSPIHNVHAYTQTPYTNMVLVYTQTETRAYVHICCGVSSRAK